MAISLTDINVGTSANDETGDPARTAFQAINTNNATIASEVMLVDGSNSLTGDLVFTEKADHSSTPGAGKGYLWVKSDTPSSLIFTDDAGTDYDLTDITSTPEGTAILSTGEVGGTKFLREDGDGTSSWQAIPAPEGTSVLSTGPVTDGYVLTADGAGGAAWEAAAGGGGTPGGSSGDIQYNNAGSFAGSYLKQGTNTIEQRNSTNAQTFNVYNAYTDASNWSRASLGWSSNFFVINATKSGTGVGEQIKLQWGAGANEASLELIAISANTPGTKLFTPANGGIGVTSSSLSNGSVTLGLATTAYSRLQGSGTSTQVRLGDNSDYTEIEAGVFEAAKAYTVATLPTASVGMIARVTDASSPSIGSAVSGGGAAFALVCYNGSAWNVIGV